MAGDRRQIVVVVREVRFVDQQIDAANVLDVVGVGGGRRIGDVGQRVIGPIEAKAERAARVLQAENA